jgi:hypothetical protein
MFHIGIVTVAAGMILVVIFGFRAFWRKESATAPNALGPHS